MAPPKAAAKRKPADKRGLDNVEESPGKKQKPDVVPTAKAASSPAKASTTSLKAPTIPSLEGSAAMGAHSLMKEVVPWATGLLQAVWFCSGKAPSYDVCCMESFIFFSSSFLEPIALKLLCLVGWVPSSRHSSPKPASSHTRLHSRFCRSCQRALGVALGVTPNILCGSLRR